MEKCELCKAVEILIRERIGDWQVVEEVCEECKATSKIYSAPTKGDCLIKHCQTCHEDYVVEKIIVV